MQVEQILKSPYLKPINSIGNSTNGLNELFSCDLLSHVMGNAKENDILITVLNNLNVLGVASLLDLSCVIFTHNTEVSEELIKKADELEIPLFVTSLSTAEITIHLSQLGV